MEERKLNLNAPLLSVRRFSSPIRATRDSKTHHDQEDDSKLLLHRRYSLPCLDQQQVTEPVAVPFHWEQIPGRRKDNDGGNSGSSRFSIRWIPSIVKNQEVKSTSEIKSLVVGRVKSEGNDHEDDDDDDKFSDALESLSAMDSCSMKCSSNGMSSSSNCLQSGNFETDPKTRDFMMSRFLPAAKAMTLDQQPQYSAKKQQQQQQQQQSRPIAVVSRLESSAAIVPYCHPKEESEEEDCDDDDDDDDEYEEESVSLPMKGCGLFLPRLCFKNSICLFSPVPGMKVKSLNSFSSSSTGKASKPSKAASSSSSSSPSTRKSFKDDASKQRPSRGVQPPRTMEVDNNKLVGGSDSFSERQMSGRISPFSRRSNGLSPYRNSAPQSPFGGTGVPRGLSKEAEMFKRNKPYLYCKGGSKSQELTPLYRTNQAAELKTSESSSLLKRSSDSSEVIMGNATGKELMVVPKTNGNDVCGELSKALVCVSGNVDAGLDTVSSGDPSSLPPVLLKTPSESWLWRTLPEVSSRSRAPMGRASSFQGKWVDSKTSSTTTATSKWETMVKSSYLHHDHVRYSEVNPSTFLSNHHPASSKF